MQTLRCYNYNAFINRLLSVNAFGVLIVNVNWFSKATGGQNSAHSSTYGVCCIIETNVKVSAPVVFIKSLDSLPVVKLSKKQGRYYLSAIGRRLEYGCCQCALSHSKHSLCSSIG